MTDEKLIAEVATIIDPVHFALLNQRRKWNWSTTIARTEKARKKAKAAIEAMRKHEGYSPFKPGDTHCSDCPCRYGQHLRALPTPPAAKEESRD